MDLIIHVLSNLPEEYEVDVSEFEEKLKDAVNPLDIEDIRQKLNSRYECGVKNTEIKEEEMTLAAFKKFFESTGGTKSKTGKSGDSIIEH